MVGAADHMNHITIKLSGQAKRLQIDQKNAEAIVRTVKWAKVATEKALKVVNTRIATIEAKLGVLSAEKDATNQALAQEKIG